MVDFKFFLSLVSGLLSFSSYNIGFALEKEEIDKLDENEKKNTLKMLLLLIQNKRWLFGLFLSILSVGFYYIALLWAPLTTIAPLSGFGLVVLAIYAHLKVNEQFRKLEVFSIILVIIGIVLSSFITAKYTKIVVPDNWNDIILSIPSIVIIALSLVISVVFAVMYFLVSYKHSFTFITIFAGIASGIQAIMVKGIAKELSNSDSETFLRVIIYFIFILLTAGGSTIGLQLAFKRGKVSTAMSIYNGLMTLLPIIYGGIVLTEWNLIPVIFQIFLGISIAITLIAIILLSLFHKHNDTD